MARDVAQSTLDLRTAFDAFVTDFEDEIRMQATKQNSSSERRMRKLLRAFTERVYIPYRDATLGQREDSDQPF